MKELRCNCGFRYPARWLGDSEGFGSWQWPETWRDDVTAGIAVYRRARRPRFTTREGKRAKSWRSLNAEQAQCPECHQLRSL